MDEITIRKKDGVYIAECQYGVARGETPMECKYGILRLYPTQEIIKFIIEEEKPRKRKK